MKIALGADHAGYALKEHLRSWLAERGWGVQDFGTFSAEPADYPDLAEAVARSVARGEEPLGILVCGSGTGMAIAANKIRGARAANCFDITSARLARAHNDANVLALGSRLIGQGLAEEIAETFLSTPFEGGRHARRVGKISALEPDSE
ncbi:MAG: ribose 5-phosphate isomerase B [Thermoanaerobaculia bacterium]